MCKEDWLVGLRHKGGGLREGGWIYLRYLKRSRNRKEGRRNKDFQKGSGKAGLGQRVGGLEPPDEMLYIHTLTHIYIYIYIYILYLYISFIYTYHYIYHYICIYLCVWCVCVCVCVCVLLFSTSRSVFIILFCQEL